MCVRVHAYEMMGIKQQPHTVAADWHSALLKPSVRRKIMCIPIIYISCVKILRMYSVKNSLRVDGNLLFSHPGGLTGQQHCILTAWGTEQTDKQTKAISTTWRLYFCFVSWCCLLFFFPRKQPTATRDKPLARNRKATVDGRRTITLNRICRCLSFFLLFCFCGRFYFLLKFCGS